jgi:acetyl-CoA acetyltransferase
VCPNPCRTRALRLQSRREPLTTRVAAQAYAEAGIAPADLGVIELHDAFTIAELLYYEALGLCGYGEAPGLLRDGVTQRSGRHPVNAGGGLLARGHPLGATGVAQVVEVARHLAGRTSTPGPPPGRRADPLHRRRDLRRRPRRLRHPPPDRHLTTA